MASGAGLLNMCHIAEKLGKHFGVDARVVDFDSGVGMPPALDYRDHPEKYMECDLVPRNPDRLRDKLPDHCRLYLGDVVDTLPEFLRSLEEGERRLHFR